MSFLCSRNCVDGGGKRVALRRTLLVSARTFCSDGPILGAVSNSSQCQNFLHFARAGALKALCRLVTVPEGGTALRGRNWDGLKIGGQNSRHWRSVPARPSGGQYLLASIARCHTIASLPETGEWQPALSVMVHTPKLEADPLPAPVLH
jgi:hypothetical protein